MYLWVCMAMCIQVSEAGNNLMCHLQYHSCTFFRQDLSRAWDSMFRPWDPPVSSWPLLAHSTCHHTWHSDMGSGTQAQVPVFTEKALYWLYHPHSLISPPCPEFSVLFQHRSHTRSLGVWLAYHILFDKCYCNKNFNFTMTFYISFQYIMKNKSSST